MSEPATTDPISEEERYYLCVTQNGVAPTFDKLQDFEQNGLEVVVGYGFLIPRWTTNKTNPTELSYWVARHGFASDDDMDYVADCFKEAAKQWNDIDFGVKITAAPNRSKAHFLVRHYKPKAGVEEKNLAVAFFPNALEDVFIYDKTLTEPFWRKHLVNTLLHEIGHIIGLRHEFALDPNETEELKAHAVRFGSLNKHSVMGKDDVNVIRDTDKKDVLDFYQLQDGDFVNGYPIKDYKPPSLGP